MLQVELSSFQSFYNASSKSPFKSFPWKSGSMHFRFLPVSPLGHQGATTLPHTLHGSDDHNMSPGAISQQQASASVYSCVALTPHTGATQGPLQAALLRCLDISWHAATPPAATPSLPHHALRQLVAAGGYITLPPCRRALLCSPRRHLSETTLLLYRETSEAPDESRARLIRSVTEFRDSNCVLLCRRTPL